MKINTIFFRVFLVPSWANRQWTMMTSLKYGKVIYCIVGDRSWIPVTEEHSFSFSTSRLAAAGLFSYPIWPHFFPLYCVTYSTEVTAFHFPYGEFGASIWQLTSIQRRGLLCVNNFLYFSCVALWPGSWLQGRLSFYKTSIIVYSS
jgi:hypothetical protein